MVIIFQTRDILNQIESFYANIFESKDSELEDVTPHTLVSAT